jgi:hypothetical protein
LTLKHRVSQQKELTCEDSWITNFDVAGWYTTKIEDVYGNEIHISYSTDSEAAPGAIDEICYGAPCDGSGGLPSKTISVETWSSTDAGNGLCPDVAIGQLKSVSYPAYYSGLPQTATYTFHYQAETITDDLDGSRAVPLLTRVDLPALDGGGGASIDYEYGEPLTTNDRGFDPGPLLTRVRYPQGGRQRVRLRRVGLRHRAELSAGRSRATGLRKRML